MSRRRRVVALGAGVAVIAAAAVVLSTRPGSTAGPWDEWGCPPEQIGSSIFEYADEGGSASREEALRAMAEFVASDGALEGDCYLGTLDLRTGPERYDPETGTLYLDDRIYARFGLGQLPDATWVVDSVTNCGVPPPEGNAPGPTPA